MFDNGKQIYLRLFLTSQYAKKNFFFRVPKDCCSNCHWILHYGIHRIFCKINTYSNQQYYSVSFAMPVSLSRLIPHMKITK